MNGSSIANSTISSYVERLKRLPRLYTLCYTLGLLLRICSSSTWWESQSISNTIVVFGFSGSYWQRLDFKFTRNASKSLNLERALDLDAEDVLQYLVDWPILQARVPLNSIVQDAWIYTTRNRYVVRTHLLGISNSISKWLTLFLSSSFILSCVEQILNSRWLFVWSFISYPSLCNLPRLVPRFAEREHRGWCASLAQILDLHAKDIWLQSVCVGNEWSENGMA